MASSDDDDTFVSAGMFRAEATVGTSMGDAEDTADSSRHSTVHSTGGGPSRQPQDDERAVSQEASQADEEDVASFLWDLTGPETSAATSDAYHATVDHHTRSREVFEYAEGTVQVSSEQLSVRVEHEDYGEFVDAVNRGEPAGDTAGGNVAPDAYAQGEYSQGEYSQEAYAQGAYAQDAYAQDAYEQDGDDNFHTPEPASLRQPKSPGHVDSVLRTAVVAEIDQTMSASVMDPFAHEAEDARVVLFGPTAMSPDEVNALRDLAEQDRAPGGDKNPLSSVVKRLFATIRFKERELDRLKCDEVHIGDVVVEEERRRHSAVQRRQSLAMQSLAQRTKALQKELNELREEHAKRGVDDSNYKHTLETELAKADEVFEQFLELAQQSDPSLTNNSPPHEIYAAVESLVASRPPTLERATAPLSADSQIGLSDSRGTRAKMDSTDYAEHLLHFERLLKESESRCETLLQEKTDLEIRLMDLERRLPSVPLSPGSLPAESPLPVGNDSSVREELYECRETIGNLQAKIDKLQDALARLEKERDAAEKRLLDQQANAEELKAKLADAQTTRASAVREQKKLADQYSALSAKYQSMSEEYTESAVAAGRQRHEYEAQCEKLRRELSDLQRALADQAEASKYMSETIERLEDDLMKSSSLLVEKSRQAGSSGSREVSSSVPHSSLSSSAPSGEASQSDGGTSSPIEARARSLRKMRDECTRLTTAVATLQQEKEYWKHESEKLREGIKSSGEGFRPASMLPSREETEAAFIRRLSATLGCPSVSTSRELIEKLIQRVESLVEERRAMEVSIERLQSTIVARERSLHQMRSEFSAEIAANKAELEQVENDRARAIADREAAEVRFMEASKREEQSTLSHYDDDTRNSILGASGSESFSRRPFDDGAEWEDPSIREAIQSLSVLIGSKDKLYMRNKTLTERLNEAIGRAGAGTGENGSVSSRALAVESSALNEELVGIITLQEKVIEKLRESATGAASERMSRSVSARRSSKNGEEGTEYENTEDDSLRGAGGSTYREHSVGPSISERRASMSYQCSEFFHEQLTQMRNMVDQQAKSKSELHGVMREMEVEVERVAGLKEEAERRLEQIISENDDWMNRIAVVANVEATAESLESFISLAVSSLESNRITIERTEQRSLLFESQLGNALAQKRVLSHILYLYQDKYQLDILAPVGVGDKGRAPIARFRHVVIMVLAATRVRRAVIARRSSGVPIMSNFVNIASTYNLPQAVNLTCRRSNVVKLDSAVLALRALPKLEAALREKNEQVSQLQASLAALEIPESRPLAELNQNQDPSEAFDYDDFIARKNDLARRLRKALKQREELSVRYNQEKREKQALEARIVKYMDKLSSYQRKLGRLKNEADARDRTYKAAIRFLKTKADSAIGDESNFGGLETEALLESVAGQENVRAEPQHGESSKAKESHPRGDERNLSRLRAHTNTLIFDQIRGAQKELEKTPEGSGKAEELKSYISGLKRAASQLQRGIGGIQ